MSELPTSSDNNVVPEISTPRRSARLFSKHGSQSPSVSRETTPEVSVKRSRCKPSFGVGFLAPIPEVATVAPESGAATVAPESDVATIAPESDVATIAPESEVATIAPESDAAAVAPESDAAAVAPESDAAAVAPESDAATPLKRTGKLSQDDQTTAITEKTDIGEKHEECSTYPAIGLFKKLFHNSSRVAELLDTSLALLHKEMATVHSRDDDLSDVFVSRHAEVVWQHIMHKNKQLGKEIKHGQYVLEADLFADESDVSDEESLHDEDDIDEEASIENVEHESDDDEEDVDLFDIDGDALDNIEKEFDDDADEHVKNQPVVKKYPKFSVDDKFFSLAEMDAFVDAAEKANEEDNIFDTADDSWTGATDYRYTDFFGTLDDNVEESVTKKRTHQGSSSIIPMKKVKKSVSFADIVDEQECEMEQGVDVVEDDSRDEDDHVKDDAPKKKKTRLDGDLAKLKETIAKHEEENLEPRTWQLSGEVAAQSREENALLETHVQFDQAVTKAPQVTEDFSTKLESIIKQRIKDQTFDDVVRKKREGERIESFRSQAIEEEQMMKKSLSEVYEKEFQKANGEVTEEPKEVTEHVAITKRLDHLYRLIDSLSHYDYTPPQLAEEVKVVTNMAALRVEEVGVMATTHEQLLAPEEMKKRQKGTFMASEEREKTDKLRERRKKKKRQSVMAEREGNSSRTDPMLSTKKLKKTKSNANAVDVTKLKSATFFKQLQSAVEQERIEKTTKKKKRVKSEKVTERSVKFKL